MTDGNLLDMNKFFFERRLGTMRDKEVKGKGSWKGWRDMVVKRREMRVIK